MEYIRWSVVITVARWVLMILSCLLFLPCLWRNWYNFVQTTLLGVLLAFKAKSFTVSQLFIVHAASLSAAVLSERDFYFAALQCHVPKIASPQSVVDVTHCELVGLLCFRQKCILDYTNNSKIIQTSVFNVFQVKDPLAERSSRDPHYIGYCYYIKLCCRLN